MLHVGLDEACRHARDTRPCIEKDEYAIKYFNYKCCMRDYRKLRFTTHKSTTRIKTDVSCNVKICCCFQNWWWRVESLLPTPQHWKFILKNERWVFTCSSKLLLAIPKYCEKDGDISQKTCELEESVKLNANSSKIVALTTWHMELVHILVRH